MADTLLCDNDGKVVGVMSASLCAMFGIPQALLVNSEFAAKLREFFKVVDNERPFLASIWGMEVLTVEQNFLDGLGEAIQERKTVDSEKVGDNT